MDRTLLYFVAAALGSTLSLALSTAVSIKHSKESVTRYVSVWEEDISRELILRTESPLFRKVQRQLRDIAPEIQSVSASDQSCDSGLEQTVPVTLYGAPGGLLVICRSQAKAILSGANSPVFWGGCALTFLVVAFTFFRRRREENQYIETLRDLEGARHLAKMARQVAHDIRAPLSALMAVSQTNGDLNETRPLLSATTDRIGKIASSLLEKSRRAEKSETHLAQSVYLILAEAKATSPRHSFETDFDFADELGPTLAVSPIDFERTLSNLLSNALEATAAVEKPQIRIEARSARDRIRLVISDNGPGIPEDIIPKLGRERISHGKESGNGIGVLSATHFMNRNRGRLKIDSDRSGTRVQLEFPINR